jgi:long-chain fatty acid transport protein
MSLSKKCLSTVAIVSISLLAVPIAHATNGYFKIGYGAKNLGMAGTGIAYGQDSLASAINPAALADVSGDRIDGGLEAFSPLRKGEVNAEGLGTPDFGGGATQGADVSKDSNANWFLIPSVGFSNDWGNGWHTGLAFVANGGLNTRYETNIYTQAFAPVIGMTNPPAGFAGILTFPPPNGYGVDPNVVNQSLQALGNNPNTGPSLGVNMAQLLITPTVTYSFDEHNSVGFSPIIARQTFRAYGLGLFQAFSSDPKHVTNNGNDYSWGYGGRIGYMGNFGKFSFGATYTSRIYMQEFDQYSGLFAKGGDFDIPSTYGLGFAFRATPKLTLAADVSRINYSEIDSLHNDGPTADEFLNAFSYALSGGTAQGTSISNPLGSSNGWGFGWDDATVIKLAADYRYDDKWEFRLGYNYADVPYNNDQALFNVLAPAVVKHHITTGLTYTQSKNSQWTLAYMHAFNNDLDYTYQGTGQYAPFSYSAKNEMKQNAFAISYGYTF